MRNTLVVASFVAAAAFAAPGFADDHAGHGQMAAKAGDMQMADGLVKKVNKSSGKVTLSHGPLTNLGMPAMTMVFRMKEAAWIDQLKEGDRIRFMADRVNGAYTVVHFDRAD